ncbi:hypothetical protein SAMN04488061_2779 [Filomicrobium insigne]|uniref:Uncharacterized protein n=1 Tax=Filomicrobium insigne TaxID=418854 RepID=A0A1H0S8C7_9HYPH|nr:hypothetical protein [Filomicrobium insigne]SDP38010.1 hypothetical protein SAMN04488061_2779 [Filomicrobium insigne]
MEGISGDQSGEGRRSRLRWHDVLLAVSLLIAVAGITSVLADHRQELTEGPEPKQAENFGWTGASNALSEGLEALCSAQSVQSITPN